MCRIIGIEEIKQEEWNGLVKLSPVATWFQTKEAYDFFNSLTFLEAFVVAVEESGVLKGLAVGYIQKEGGKLKQFFSRRAIILGGPLLAENITGEALKLLLKTLYHRLRNKAIYIETRNLNDYTAWQDIFIACRFEYKEHLNFQVDCSSREELWKKLKENRKRQIQKSLGQGVEVVEPSSEADIISFYGILVNLYSNRIKKPLFPLEFFVQFYRHKLGKYLLVKYQDEIIGGIMCPILPGRALYEWFVCGKDVEYKALFPSVMGTWAAMEYASNNHLERFDFMGAGKPDEAYGVRDFKARFGGKMVEHGRFLCVCNRLLFGIGKFGVNMLKKL